MKLRVGEQGRMVIPLDRKEVLNRLKKLFAQIPSEISMVDELIFERRIDSERENAGILKNDA